MLIIQMVAIQILTFLALAFFLHKFMYSTSFRETRRLRLMNDEHRKKTEELSLRMEDAQNQCEKKISEAQEEAKRLKARSREDSERLKEELLNKAKEEAEHLLNKAIAGKEKIRKEIEEQMRGRVIERSLKLIQEVFNPKNQQILHSALIEDLIEGIDKISGEAFGKNIEKFEVIAPCETDRGQIERISAVVFKKINKKITIEEKIDVSLILGAVVKLDGIIIDGSLSSRLKEANSGLKE